MRRCFAAAVLGGVVIAVVGSAVPASAGGWDSLQFRRQHYLVGNIATARTEFFAGDLKGSGPLDGRTYHAYLLPRTRTGFGMIDPPAIPDGAIRLGALDVQGPLMKSDGYPYGIASLTFTVPDVPSGAYPIGFCDDPCTYGTVGWLAWGDITIVHTSLEGRLLATRDRAKAQIGALRRVLRRTEGETAQLAERFAVELRAARTAIRASDRVDMAAGGADVRGAAPAEPSDGPPWWLATLAGLAVGALGTWALVGHGRHAREAVPLNQPDAAREAEPADRERDPAGV